MILYEKLLPGGKMKKCKCIAVWVGLIGSTFLLAQMVEVIIGTDTTYSNTGPINTFYNYSIHEAIYLRNEINIAGQIESIAYYKQAGYNYEPIPNVTIYMKHTLEEILVTGVYSLGGYTEVFNDSFPNSVYEGWMQVPLTPPFNYDNLHNLQILVWKGPQNYIGCTLAPKYRYTTTAPIYRAKQAYNDGAPPTNLNQTYIRPNIRLIIRLNSNIQENNSDNHLYITECIANPNPFTNKTNISFNLSAAEKVSLKIYDASGKLVRTLVNGLMSSGDHNFIWNGTDEHSNKVEEGIYFYTLETPKHNYSRKLVLIRQ